MRLFETIIGTPAGIYDGYMAYISRNVEKRLPLVAINIRPGDRDEILIQSSVGPNKRQRHLVIRFAPDYIRLENKFEKLHIKSLRFDNVYHPLIYSYNEIDELIEAAVSWFGIR